MFTRFVSFLLYLNNCFLLILKTNPLLKIEIIAIFMSAQTQNFESIENVRSLYMLEDSKCIKIKRVNKSPANLLKNQTICTHCLDNVVVVTQALVPCIDQGKSTGKINMYKAVARALIGGGEVFIHIFSGVARVIISGGGQSASAEGPSHPRGVRGHAPPGNF